MKRIYFLALIQICFLFAEAQQTVGLIKNSPSSFDGYTLFAPHQSTETYLINNCGELVHSWSSQFITGFSVYLLEDGNLLRTSRTSITETVFIELLDWNSNLLWSYDLGSEYGDHHHDIEILPDGNILIIAYDIQSREEVEINGGSTNKDFILSDQIIEVQPDLKNGGARVVWEWRAWDHLLQDADSTKINFGIIADHPERININAIPFSSSDWLHFNAIDYNADLDQILISCPRYNEIWVIDHSTNSVEASGSCGGIYGQGGDLLYRWGNPVTYNQGEKTNQKLFFQHHAYWIPKGFPDEGSIMIFNNRAGEAFGEDYSEVNIINPPIQPDGFYLYQGESYGPSESELAYRANPATDFYSRFVSSAEKLENGNILICAGVTGRYFEVDSIGNIVWEYINPVDENGIVEQGEIPVNNFTFRIIRYAPSYPGLSGLELIPQGFIEIGSDIKCNLYADSLSTSTSNAHDFDISVFPNPVEDILIIQSEQIEITNAKLYNLQGLLLLEKNTDEEGLYISVHGFASGIYLLLINDRYFEKVTVQE